MVRLRVFLLIYTTRANGAYISRDVACHHGSSTQGYVGSTFHGARRAGLSISETADLLGFHAQPFLGFTENGLKKMGQFCGRKCLVDVRGQRMARLVQADRKENEILCW